MFKVKARVDVKVGRGRSVPLSELARAYAEDAGLSFRHGARKGGPACGENIADGEDGVSQSES